MTDEELSELAECIEDACRGYTVRPFYGRLYPSRCVLAALLGGDERYPSPMEGVRRLGLDSRIIYGIVRGFDGADHLQADDLRAFNLGLLFREQYK